MQNLYSDFCSFLFVPADTDRFLAKASLRGADALILDLEDAVVPLNKEAARANLKLFIPQLKSIARVPIFVRVNNQPNLLTADLEAAVAAGADGLLLPKIDTALQMEYIDELLNLLENKYHHKPESVPVLALLESPVAICNAYQIAASSQRLCGLLFGTEDFAAESGVDSNSIGMMLPAQLMVLAALAAGLQPLGLPGTVAEFTDLDSYRATCIKARAIGMKGAICIHPAQISVVNDVFGGTAEEADQARCILKVFNAAVANGRGAVAHEGRMIDEPVALRARHFLQRYETLQLHRNRAKAQL